MEALFCVIVLDLKIPSGPEVDIANGRGIVKVVQGCKSVKPVVLVSYKSIGDRLTGVKDLAHILVGMIPGIEDHMRGFSFLFTKYPDKEKKRIHASLINIRSTMKAEEKSYKSFMDFFDNMILNTKKETITIDPITDEPGMILEGLARSAAIKHPEEVFRFSRV